MPTTNPDSLMRHSEERTLSPLERELLEALRKTLRLLNPYADPVPPDVAKQWRQDGHDAIAKAEALAKTQEEVT